MVGNMCGTHMSHKRQRDNPLTLMGHMCPLQARSRTAMNNKIRVVFTSERPLSKAFRPKFQPHACPSGCLACATSEKPHSCFRKCVVYKVSCSKCSAIYIGQTERTIRSHILEHIKREDSCVRQHMLSHGDLAHVKCFTWCIIGANKNFASRLALQIKRHSPHLMNGCEGVSLLGFL